MQTSTTYCHRRVPDMSRTKLSFLVPGLASLTVCHNLKYHYLDSGPHYLQQFTWSRPLLHPDLFVTVSSDCSLPHEVRNTNCTLPPLRSLPCLDCYDEAGPLKSQVKPLLPSITSVRYLMNWHTVLSRDGILQLFSLVSPWDKPLETFQSTSLIALQPSPSLINSDSHHSRLPFSPVQDDPTNLLLAVILPK